MMVRCHFLWIWLYKVMWQLWCTMADQPWEGRFKEKWLPWEYSCYSFTLDSSRHQHRNSSILGRNSQWIASRKYSLNAVEAAWPSGLGHWIWNLEVPGSNPPSCCYLDLFSVVPISTPWPRCVNSQLVSLPPVGILNSLCSIWSV